MAKIKVCIKTDEVYPVYFISLPDEDSEHLWQTIKIDDSLYREYVKVKKAWDEVQAELKAIY